MRIDITDAQMLGALDKQGRELGAAIEKTSADFVSLFRATCERHGLDPDKVAIDFETGDVHVAAQPRAPMIGIIKDLPAVG